MTLEEKVIAIVCDSLHTDASAVKAESSFVNDLGAQIGLTAVGYARLKTLPDGYKIDHLIGTVYSIMNTLNSAQKLKIPFAQLREHFASWEEYGRSFAFGRGVWHGDEEDCQIAWEIVSELFENETSPWRQISWVK